MKSTTQFNIETSLDVIMAEQLLRNHKEGLKTLTDKLAIALTKSVIENLENEINAFRVARKKAIFGPDYYGKGL